MLGATDLLGFAVERRIVRDNITLGSVEMDLTVGKFADFPHTGIL